MRDALSSNMTVNLQSGKVELITGHEENWTVHLVDTGPKTNTGGRLKRLEPWLSDGTFLLTYGDGVSNVDLNALLALPINQPKAHEL